MWCLLLLPALLIVVVACDISSFNVGGDPYANPPEIPARPSLPSANASAEQIANYDRELSKYQEALESYEEDLREYDRYWSAHEQGYTDGRRRTCDAAEDFLAGASASRVRHTLDKYYDGLPRDTIHEKAYAKGFKEGRDYVNDTLDQEQLTLWDFAIVCQ